MNTLCKIYKLTNNLEIIKTYFSILIFTITELYWILFLFHNIHFYFKMLFFKNLFLFHDGVSPVTCLVLFSLFIMTHFIS